VSPWVALSLHPPRAARNRSNLSEMRTRSRSGLDRSR
jgi:hypothetical protein